MRAARVAALAGTLLASGCGGSGQTATTRPVHLTAQERRGKVLFVRACGSCHTLADARTNGIAGPPLDQPWSASRVRETIADGPGQMPDGLLDGRAAAAVAAYIAAATGGS